ncbi:hypothetical protein U0035_00700 [Niabella yanshanensis]|uniref:Uncharacterized protein n=1 Tax=Niabella yanshanensis TaxID=577386 RepID=A0ABZ0W6T9_9BACT|nr:hypothetical protein [Niabella yanshanensis]WQD38664.1 hypothetical protein U0035_00700 [Niabella yanshanensis]
MLKSIQFNRFLAAVHKLAMPVLRPVAANTGEKERPLQKQIFVNINKKISGVTGMKLFI